MDTGADADTTLTASPWWDLARLMAVVLGVVVLTQMAARLGDVVGLVLLAGALALLTDPVRRRLARRLKPGAAVVVTALLTIVVIVTLAALLFQDLAAQAQRLSDDLVERVRDLRPGTLPARVATSLDAERGIEEVFSRLPATVVAGEEDTTGVGRQLIDMLLVVILAAFFQSGAANMLDWLTSRWPRQERRSVRDLADDVERRGGGYVRRVILLGGLVAAAVTTTAWIVAVPGAVVLGMWAGVWITVPVFGWFVGLVPVALIAWSDGPVEGAVFTVVLLALAVGGTWVRRRVVDAHQLRLGPALVVLALAGGLAIAGFGGALVTVVAVSLLGAALTSPLPLVRPGATVDPDDPAVDPDVLPDAAHAGTRALLRQTPDGVLVAPGWRGAITVAGAAAVAVLIWGLIGRLGVVAVWVVIAGLVAIALARPVGWVARRLHVPRTVAVVLVFLVAVGVVGTAVVAGVEGGASTGSEITAELPTVVRDLEDLPVVGSWLRERDAATWVSEQMTDLPQRVADARDVSEWLPTIGARLLDLWWTVLLALALLLDGPRLVAAAERRVPASRRRQFARLVQVSDRAIGGYLAGAALVASINASVILAIALALGVALAPVLAVWGFVWNFVPQIGGFMGGFPLVVLALAAGPLQAVAAGVLFISYQFIENHLIQPAVIAEAIDVPPWATLLAALGGGAAAGVIGAVVLTPLVGVVRVVRAEVGRRDFPGNTVPIDTTATEPGPAAVVPAVGAPVAGEPAGPEGSAATTPLAGAVAWEVRPATN